MGASAGGTADSDVRCESAPYVRFAATSPTRASRVGGQNWAGAPPALLCCQSATLTSVLAGCDACQRSRATMRLPWDHMNIDVYSDRAKQAIQSAQSLALARGHQQLAPEHILKVLPEEKDGLSRALIQSAGGRPDEADKAVDIALGKLPKVEGGSGQLYMKPETARVFAGAELGAKQAGDAFVTTERLLLAIS